MKLSAIAAVAAVGVVVSGCATIVEGTTQPVSVSTVPEQGAACTLSNSQGTWYLTSPGSTTVHKTKTDLTIDCTKTGYAPGHLVATSHFGGTTFGNIILGGVVGAGVDAASGANFYYDNPITVPLGERTGPTAAQAAPPTSASAPPPEPDSQAGQDAPINQANLRVLTENTNLDQASATALLKKYHRGFLQFVADKDTQAVLLPEDSPWSRNIAICDFSGSNGAINATNPAPKTYVIPSRTCREITAIVSATAMGGVGTDVQDDSPPGDQRWSGVLLY